MMSPDQPPADAAQRLLWDLFHADAVQQVETNPDCEGCADRPGATCTHTRQHHAHEETPDD